MLGGGAPAATTPAAASGIQFQTSNYGPPLTVLYGRNKIAAHVINYFDFSAAPQETQVGKGGGGSVSGYKYKVTYLVALGEGPFHSINGLWDQSTPLTLDKAGATPFLGTATQNAWSQLPSGRDLTYRYTAFCGFLQKDLGSSPSLPNYNWDATGLLPFNAGVIDGADPSAIANDICTNAEHGINFPFLGDLTAWHQYCVAAGIFLSPVYNQQQSAQQTLSDLCTFTNTAPFWSEGQLKFTPYGDEAITGNGEIFAPDLTPLYDLDDNDFCPAPGEPPVKMTIKDPTDAYNRVMLEVVDAAKQFAPVPVEAKDKADIEANGEVFQGTQSCHMITDPVLGRFVAQLLVQRSLYGRKVFQFILHWNYADLEQMDIVTLTDAALNLGKFPVRITKLGESADGEYMEITAEEFPAGIGHAALYGQQAGQGNSANLEDDPGPVQTPFFVRAPGFMVQSPEIWCAVCGTTDLWGGAHVYISYDAAGGYDYLTTITRGARYGVLPDGLATSAGDPDTAHTPKVNLYNGSIDGGTHADADEFATACLIDTEVCAYAAATPTGVADQWQLEAYIRRGGYNTAVAAHAANAGFIRIDDNLIRIPIDPGSVGQTVYVKFVSFNIYGRGVEDIAVVPYHSYVIGSNLEVPEEPPTPESLDVSGVADGIKITFTNPNPAAVAKASIERSPDGIAATVLAEIDGEGFTDHFTDGASYYYRVRVRTADFVWSAYTVWMNATGKTVADGATTNITGVLSNPKDVIATAPDGTGGDYSGATGTFRVWDSSTDVTGSGPAYSVASHDAGLTIAINAATGVYTVSALTVNQATAILQAVYGGVTVQETYKIEKDLNGKSIRLTASRQTFAYTNNALNPGQANITLDALTVNIAGSVVWSTSPAATLTGSSSSRTLTAANFDAAGANEVVVTITAGGVSDQVGVIRIGPKIDQPVYNDLIINGGFEQADYWTGGTIVASGGAEGGYMKLTGAAGAETVVKQADSAGNQRYIPVAPGDRLYVPIKAYRTAGNATPKVRLYSYDAAKGSEGTTMTGALQQSSSWPVTHSVFEVPAGVYFVTPALVLGSDGTSASTIRFDDIHLYKNSFERSSADLTIPTGFTYTCDDASITWAWAGLTIYWADGSTTVISDGSHTFTGLAASTIYYFYPRWDLLAQAIGWGSGALTAPSYTESQAAHAYTVIPLSASSMAAATVASGGSGGGGGGGFGSCLHEADPVDVRRGRVRAIEIKPYDEVWTASGWQPVITVEHKAQKTWIRVTLDNGDVFRWTPEQPVRDWNGESVLARDLTVGTALAAGNQACRRVDGVALREEDATKVILGIPAPHWFFQTLDGPEPHNGTVKP